MSDHYQRSEQTGLTAISPSMDFRGQTVLVTGGADGIGAAEVKALHHFGAHVIALDVQEDKLQQLESALGHRRITTIKFDLSTTDQAAYDNLADQVVKSSPTGKIDAYIMNAGVVKLSGGKGVSGTPAEDFRKLNQINALSHADIFRALRDHFADDARIVVTSSPIVGRGDVNTPGYAASKGLLESMAKNIAGELAGTDMKVVGYVPPPVQNFLRKDLKPNEPYYAHPEGADIAELPLRLASRGVRDMFHDHVVAMGYDHLRNKNGETPDGSKFDYMPRDPQTNGFLYDLRLREIASGGGDTGAEYMRWDTSSSRELQGLGPTPDMEVGKAIDGMYDAPKHVRAHRPEPKV